MKKRLMFVLAIFLPVFSPIGLLGCDRQAPPSKAVKELPQVPDPAMGGMAGSAMDKAKGVETTIGEASNRIAENSKEGTP